MKEYKSGGLACGNAGNGLASGGLGAPPKGNKHGGRPKDVRSTERRDRETPTKFKDTGLS